MHSYDRSTDFRRLYAQLKVSMSMEDAARILGVEPGASDDEINRAYKKKVFENHPDRGGDPAKMVEVNVAKEVLEGKRRPSYDRTPSAPSETYPDYTPSQERWKEPDPITVDFNQAKSKAGVPSNVEWLFVTDRQRSQGSYSGDESSRWSTGYVAYGRTAEKHYFVGMHHHGYSGYYVGHGGNTDVWDMKVLDFPLKEGDTTQPAWLYGNVVKALKAVGWEGRFNSKVYDCRGWEFTEKFKVNGGAKSIKHILVDLGLVAGDDPSVANRKHVIEFLYERSYKEDAGFTKPLPNSYDFERYSIVLNGRELRLDKNDMAAVAKARFGGKPLLRAIFGDYYYDKSKKNLTRMKAGKAILEWMSEKLTSLPADAREALKASAANMK